MDGYTYELLTRVEAKLDFLVEKLQEAEEKNKPKQEAK